VVITKAELKTFETQDMRSTPTEIIKLRFCKGVKASDQELNMKYTLVCASVIVENRLRQQGVLFPGGELRGPGEMDQNYK
jgi:hypothetical protein